MKYNNSLSFAKALDRADVLKSFRKLFYIPQIGSKPSLYFTGNSLGLQPKSTLRFIAEELNDWARLGVEGHFHAKRPWYHFHKFSKNALARLAGAKPSEVVAMNQLTVNLHLMMVSFYRPSGKRFKIMTEAGAFSSDQYAFESQVNLAAGTGGQGFNREEAIIELQPRPGEYCLRTEDILRAIADHGDQLALIVFGAVQYYSGQLFNIKAITPAWCGYKYLNAGPGGVAGVFVHERHANSFDLPRLAGWWGYDEKSRFQMKKGFRPMPGVDGWQLSNFPVISGAAQLASLEIFDRAGMKSLRKKSTLLTGYLVFLLNEINSDQYLIITPANPAERGCQLSIRMRKNGKKIFKALSNEGVIADWRDPDVIRVAPVPLYNTFEEVYQFAEIFKKAVAGS